MSDIAECFRSNNWNHSISQSSDCILPFGRCNSFLCFSHPNVLYMPSRKMFLYHVTIFSKRPITDSMDTLMRQQLWIDILKRHVLEIYHCNNHSLKGEVFVKCKCNYGRLSRKLNQVAFLDIHRVIIFYRPQHLFFLKGCS